LSGIQSFPETEFKAEMQSDRFVDTAPSGSAARWIGSPIKSGTTEGRDSIQSPVRNEDPESTGFPALSVCCKTSPAQSYAQAAHPSRQAFGLPQDEDQHVDIQ
jgi:hypothetical protein